MLPASSYTGPSGNTPQGQQTDQQISSLQAAAASGVPVNDQQVNNLYGTLANQSQNLQTPQARQQYLDNTQLAPMQNNYDQLAQQLAQYDQMSLKPQFEGQNPGTPSDLPNNPDVTFGNVSYLTPNSSQLPASQGIYNANPMYALSAQTDQGNSIASLLDTIQRGIGSQVKQGTGNYVGSVNAVSNALGNLKDIMSLSTQLKISQANQARSSASNPLYLKSLLAAELQKVQGKDLHVSPTDYAQIKNEASLLGVDAKDYDTWFQSYRNPDQNELFPSDTYEVDPAALTAQERTANQKAVDTKKAQTNINDFADQMMTNWEKMGPAEKTIGAVPGLNTVGLLAPNIVENDAIFYNQLIKEIKTKIGGRLTNQEINLFHTQLPGPYDSPETAQYKIDTLKGLLTQKLANPDSQITNLPGSNSGVNINSVKTNLKNAGYNDNQINSYLQLKGLQ